MDLQPGAVVVPAYLRDDRDVTALCATVASLPPCVADCVVVAQPGPQGMPSLKGLPQGFRVQLLGLPAGVGKWPAFAQGLTLLGEATPWVAVVDADGAFPPSALVDLLDSFQAQNLSHAIGARSPEKIDLRVSGLEGGQARLHLEAFCNTLVLLGLGRAEDLRYRGADIQCGLHIFSQEKLVQLRAQALPFYGGELQVFHDSLKAGLAVGFAPVDVGTNPVSTYAWSEILAGLMQLPFIAATDLSTRREALRRAPEVYAAWNLDPVALAKDIASLGALGSAPERP